ncbi:MAG TPA: SDR family oxidoreductase [Alphaproteobacteria bacterium]|nr:SDR family oxidoreductase [Alphaproteobacteria bacterium]
MLSGRTVVITGASQGVGKGLALAVAAEGAATVVTARNLEVAEGVVEEIRAKGQQAIALRCDVTDRAEVEAVVAKTLERFERIDAVVHNATSRFSGRGVPLQNVTDEDWNDQVAVGLRAAFHCAQACFSALRDTAGTFIVLTSNAGIEGSLPLPVYSAIKGAQRGLVKALAREWGPDGIRVNAIAPVAMTPAMGKFFEDQPQMRQHIESGAALRRVGEPADDIGPVLTFLIGPDSGFITGQTLLVNGGATMV